MFERINNWFSKKKVAKKYTAKPKKPTNEKEIATANEEPYIKVLETKLNPDNPRNGFFELDWNQYFVEHLRTNGFRGSTDEEVVDQWFQELCRNIASEQELTDQLGGSGYVNLVLRDDGKTEIG